MSRRSSTTVFVREATGASRASGTGPGCGTLQRPGRRRRSCGLQVQHSLERSYVKTRGHSCCWPPPSGRVVLSTGLWPRPLAGRARTPLRAADDGPAWHVSNSVGCSRRAAECAPYLSFPEFFARAALATGTRAARRDRLSTPDERNSPPMPRAPSHSSARAPLPRSGAEPVHPGGASGMNAGAPRPAQLRLQVNLIVGEQVFSREPFEISAAALATLRRQMGLGVLPAGVTADSATFALRRCHEVWQVVFEGDQGFFGHTTGMTFIDHHLKHPGEAIHPVVLLARLQGQEPVQQRSVALDDQDATDEYLRQMDDLRAVILD